MGTRNRTKKQEIKGLPHQAYRQGPVGPPRRPEGRLHHERLRDRADRQPIGTTLYRTVLDHSRLGPAVSPAGPRRCRGPAYTRR
jgi:hypothetical protein